MQTRTKIVVEIGSKPGDDDRISLFRALLKKYNKGVDVIRFLFDFYRENKRDVEGTHRAGTLSEFGAEREETE